MAAPAAMQLPATVRQHLFASGAEAAQALAAMAAEALREGLRQRGTALLFVSGGRTPAAFMDALSTQALDWAGVVVSLADDRWVAADNADSNELLVRQHLLRGPAAAARFMPLVDAALTPQQHLAAVEQALAQLPHPCDAVVLGMGEDGHTASLFPGADGTAAALDLRRPQRVAAVTPVTAPYPRITLTLRALLDARALMILLQGEAKRATIEMALRCDPAQHGGHGMLRQEAVPVHLFYSP